MKTKFITAFVIAAVALASSVAANAQPGTNPGEDWKKKMMSEKVAFFTVELDLTPEEAQKFWAVYNQIDKERDEANDAVFMSYMELERAIKEKKTEKEISNLLDKYIKALDLQGEINSKADEKYRKVLPVAKVAKLYTSEEEFRRQYIRRLRGTSNGGHRR